jgi:hypothetical protein
MIVLIRSSLFYICPSDNKASIVHCILIIEYLGSTIKYLNFIARWTYIKWAQYHIFQIYINIRLYIAMKLQWIVSVSIKVRWSKEFSLMSCNEKTSSSQRWTIVRPKPSMWESSLNYCKYENFCQYIKIRLWCLSRFLEQTEKDGIHLLIINCNTNY